MCESPTQSFGIPLIPTTAGMGLGISTETGA
jgi:hypothetical protein